MLMKKWLLFFTILAVILVAGCVQSEKKPAESPTPVPTPAPIVSPIKETADLREIAEKIRNGDIDVGKDYTMSLYGRYHTIHNKVLGLDCSTCHVSSKYADDFLYQRKYKVPVRGAPGVVDRGVCLGCHKAGGPAFELYGTADE